MNDFNNKSIYDSILEMEELYNKIPMEYIKENSYQIKLTRREQHVNNCRNNNKKIGAFRLFEGLLEYETEKTYINKTHPYNIPFIKIIKICKYLNITLDELSKKPQDRVVRVKNKEFIKWSEQLVVDFLKDYNNLDINYVSEKYNISKNSAIRYYEHFSKGQDILGRKR